MKFSAKHSVKQLVAYASGNANQYDDMVQTSGDANPVLCVINHDDLVNIENEIRSAYETGYQEAIMFSFEKTPHVCASCGSDEWHSNQTFYNRQKYWLPDEIEFWCHECEAEVDVIKKEEYEEEKENGERS